MPLDLHLRDVAPGDLEVFFEQERDPVAVRMAAFTPKDPSDRAAFLAHWGRLLCDPRITVKAIVVGRRVAGSIASFEQDGRREVTYWIGRDHWGRGIATGALLSYLAIDARRPLFARAAADNVGSIRVLERCGFALTARERSFSNARGSEIEEMVLRLDAPAAPRIAFRALTTADLPSMHRWLNQPHVRDTYGLGKAASLPEVVAKYGPLVEGATGTAPFVILLDCRDVGYVQTYRIADHPAYARDIGVDDESAGIDLFLGEPDWGHGLGPLVIDRFVREVVFAMTTAVAVVSDPSSTNPRSVRAFEKAGFRRLRTVVPTEPGCGDLLLRRDHAPGAPTIHPTTEPTAP